VTSDLSTREAITSMSPATVLPGSSTLLRPPCGLAPPLNNRQAQQDRALLLVQAVPISSPRWKEASGGGSESVFPLLIRLKPVVGDGVAKTARRGQRPEIRAASSSMGKAGGASPAPCRSPYHLPPLLHE